MNLEFDIRGPDAILGYMNEIDARLENADNTSARVLIEDALPLLVVTSDDMDWKFYAFPGPRNSTYVEVSLSGTVLGNEFDIEMKTKLMSSESLAIEILTECSMVIYQCVEQAIVAIALSDQFYKLSEV